MNFRSSIIRTMTVVIMVVLSGCAANTADTKSAMNEEQYNPKIDPGEFTSKVDNKYFSLKPGQRFVYRGKSEDGPERIVVNVTGRIKRVMGVSTLVVRDRVWLKGELIEDTFDWYAQDKDGAVWYFGEDSREMESGKVVSTKGSWEAGVDGAKPGIVMPAKPKVGDSFRQEYYEGIAEDVGDIVALNQKVTVPVGTFKNTLKTRDWSYTEKTLNEHKYYSPKVGFVVLEKSVDGKEKVELVSAEG